MILFIRQIFFCGIVFLFVLANLKAQDIDAGKTLFKSQCASCHKIDKKLIGPPLKGVTSTRTKEWLHAWVKDNFAFRKTGDKDAIAIFEEYKGSPMTAFPNLSSEDIDNILAYVDAIPEKTKIAGASTSDTSMASQQQGGFNESVVLGIFVVILLLLLLLLHHVKNTLFRLDGKPAISLLNEITFSIKWFLRQKKIMGILWVVVVFICLVIVWGELLAIGVDEGYQPIQPIAFSHKLHAGANGIDCNYCHSSARQGKVAGVPSANVCMNCHMYVQTGTNDAGTKEIAKIYNAVGFDPENVKYKENYEQKPIKWVRIHELQDFVYFNHSQHVVVGKVACQECHGPVETMDEVYQHSKLTMQWCLDCHRTKQVDMNNNPYYEKIHQQLAKKYGTEKVTVSMMGGIECAKCHY